MTASGVNRFDGTGARIAGRFQNPGAMASGVRGRRAHRFATWAMTEPANRLAMA
jgi:hypothetical protein